jgi:hypothetical protein
MKKLFDLEIEQLHLLHTDHKDTIKINQDLPGYNSSD